MLQYWRHVPFGSDVLTSGFSFWSATTCLNEWFLAYDLFELSLDASVVPESCIHVMMNFDCGTHLSHIILSLVISFFSPLLSVCFD
jgi:hypothetical protein